MIRNLFRVCFGVRQPLAQAWALAALLASAPAFGQSLPASAYKSIVGDVSAATVEVPGASAGVSLAAWAGQTVNVKLLGAKGDGVTDDTSAFATAIASVNTAAASGVASCLYVPPGRYLINGATLPSFSQNTGGGICGAGSWKSVVQIGTSYAGDLFSWSDAWYSGVYNGASNQIVTPQKLGPRATGFTVLGSNASGAQQNALVFYDHNDTVLVDDVDVENLNGRALYAGATKNDTVAYIRESRISNLRVFNSGASGVPAVEITSQCSASCAGQDASNEIDLSSVDVYGSLGPSLVLRNAMPSNGGSMRQIRMAKIRVEGKEGNPNGVTADLLQIGDGAMSGPMAAIRCDGCELISPYTNYAAVSVNSANGVAGISEVYFSGMISAGAGGGYGVKINAGAFLTFDLTWLSSVQTNVTVASSASTGAPILIDGQGGEQQWTWSVDSSALSYVCNRRNLCGSLQGASASEFVSIHRSDGTVYGGNVRGMGSVDWQTQRFGADQVASGTNAVIAGGNANKVPGTESVVAGGWNNVNIGYRSAIGGGAGNLAGGSYSVVPGGINANTQNNYGVMAFASGQFATPGDAQLYWGVLRAATSSASATRLTADGGGANGDNVWNLQPNSAFQFDLSCLYRDTTNGKAQSWEFLGVLMTQGASASTTALSAPAATNGANIGSPGATAPTLAADTANGGLNISFTPPNSDASHIVCGVSGVFAQ